MIQSRTGCRWRYQPEHEKIPTILYQRLEHAVPVFLIWSVLLLLPFSRWSELPMLLMAVGGCVLWARHGRALLAMRAMRLMLILWACYWVPALLSAVDATAPEKTWLSVLAMLRFVPVAGYAIWTMRDAKSHRRLLLLAACLVGLWIFDALLQAVAGFNLLGMPMSEDRLNGIFGADLKLAHVLAALAPLLLEYTRRHTRRAVFLAAYTALLTVIVVVGTRAAWVMFAVVSLAYLYIYARHHPRRWIKSLTWVVGVAILAAGLGYRLLPVMAKRVDRTLLVVQGDWQSVDAALGFRLPIWATAIDMAIAHPINGVGVRGFRYAYIEHAARDDRWLRLDTQTGAYHAHQIVLEVATETGVIGLLGLALGLWFAWRHWRALSPSGKERSLPYALALVGIFFPVNTHLAFYSTFWSVLCWWFVIVYCAADER